MTWNELIESCKKDHRTLWTERIRLLEETGQTAFTYNEIAEVWGASKSNTFVRLHKWADDWPTLIQIDEESEPHKVIFDFSEEAPIERPAYPLFLTEKSYANILERVPLGLTYTVSVERLAWQQDKQRGGLEVKLLDINLPIMQAIFRLDNGHVVNKPRWEII
jgi:hypothetical protein